MKGERVSVTEREKFERHAEVFSAPWRAIAYQEYFRVTGDICRWIAAEEARREQATQAQAPE